jgi:hypothetical protein
LGAKAYTTNFGCIPQGTQIPPDVEAALNGLQQIEGNTSGQLASLTNIEGKMYLYKYAAEKYHSVAPDAIKQALETMGDQPLWWPGMLSYHFSATSHFGMAGNLAGNTCAMAPLTEHKIPFIAQ